MADLALILASVAATIVALDIGLRITSLVTPRRGVMRPVPARHQLATWIDVFPPGYSGTLASQDFTVHIRAGSLGLRERDLDVQALSAERPIVFLGDSYFFGWGVEQEQRLSELLARKLSADGRPVPVVNLSFPGWSTYHYLEVWKQFVPSLKPRLVIMSAFVGNDFIDNLKQVGRPEDGMEPSADAGPEPASLVVRGKLAAREVMSTSPVLSVVNHALWISPTFRRIFNGLEIRNDRIAIYETGTTDLQSQLYAATESAFDAVARLSHAQGVPVLVVLIPDHLQVLMPDLFRGYDIDKPQRRLTAFLDARRIASIDLLPMFRRLPAPDQMFFREDKHWNAKGHEFVADVLHQRVREGVAPE